MSEIIASVIVGILGLIVNALQGAKKEKEQSNEEKDNELRQALAENDTAAVHGGLADQHDRVREALCDCAGGRDGDHQQAGT
ncbi:MAG: hypothetical protein P4L42_13420 [Desulfocapsaceae bacterium]|nr:hypothetical protein [Desulfocapsaceae bacterium]